MLELINLRDTDDDARNTVAGWLVKEFGRYDLRFSSVDAVLELLSQREHAFVTKVNGELISTISFVERDDLTEVDYDWYITDFVVRQDKRGMGYGSPTFDLMVEYVRGLGFSYAHLYVTDSTAEGIDDHDRFKEAFYGRHGFTPVTEMVDGMPEEVRFVHNEGDPEREEPVVVMRRKF